jgi:DNA helicase-2/ATP-dependent DNA helicase PcrA
MRAFEERFVQLGIPYRVVGGPRFYERQEIRDALAYLRVVAQPDDDLAFERIFNKPKRGLGDAALQAVHKMARVMKTPLLAAARALTETDELPARTRSALRDLTQSFARWSDQATALSHIELAEMVLDESGYTAMWQTDRTAEAPGRLENLKELVRSMEEFDGLGGFLEHVSLVMEIEQSETTDKVTIMTLHGAKGLEFPTVFLPGWEEGLFPSQRTLDENLTRARERAKISYAANRRVHGMWQSAMPSRFIAELPPDAIIVESDPGLPYGNSNLSTAPAFDSGYSSPGWQRAQARRGEIFGSRPAIEAHAELVATSDPAAETFRRGERVFHQKFGYGRVAAIDGNKLTVDFDKAGEKRVIANFLARA